MAYVKFCPVFYMFPTVWMKRRGDAVTLNQSQMTQPLNSSASQSKFVTSKFVLGLSQFLTDLFWVSQFVTIKFVSDRLKFLTSNSVILFSMLPFATIEHVRDQLQFTAGKFLLTES
jgi:hypothetical protein